MKKIVSHIVCMALLALLCFGTVACGKKVGGGLIISISTST